MSGNKISILDDGVLQGSNDLVNFTTEYELVNFTKGSIGILNWDDLRVGTRFTIKELSDTRE